MLLAIDPATLCGFACENGKSGTWNLKKRSSSPLLRMEHLLERAIAEWHVTAIASENAAGGSWRGKTKGGKYMGGSMKTMAFHNQLLGVIKLVAARHNLPLLVLWPATIKAFATGKPYANKALMHQRLRLMHPEHAAVENDNEVDALWIKFYALANPYGPPKKKKRKGPKRPRKPKLVVDQGRLPF